jgi:hypothetical protein
MKRIGEMFDRRASRGGLAVVVVCAVLAVMPGAASARLGVTAQFQVPAAGQIELVAVVFRARFNGKVPVYPLRGVSLPQSGPPQSYGLLTGERCGGVKAHVARCVWLTVVLQPLTSTSVAQVLVSEDRTLYPITRGISGAVHPESQTIDLASSNGQELSRLGVAFKAADVFKNLLAENFHPLSYGGGVFGWPAGPSVINPVWNAAWGVLRNSPAGTTGAISAIGNLLGQSFAGASPATATDATWTVASSPGAASYSFRTTGLRFSIGSTNNVAISAGTAPPGYACHQSAPLLVCETLSKQGPSGSAMVSGGLDYSASGPFPQLAVSVNGGPFTAMSFVGDTVTGDGQRTSSGPGSAYTPSFTIDARSGPSGENAQGTMTIDWGTSWVAPPISGAPYSTTVQVTNLCVTGDTATIVGLITGGTNATIGDPLVTEVQGGSAPSMGGIYSSSLYFGGRTPAEVCQNPVPPENPSIGFLPLSSGNITVTDATPKARGGSVS